MTTQLRQAQVIATSALRSRWLPRLMANAAAVAPIARVTGGLIGSAPSSQRLLEVQLTRTLGQVLGTPYTALADSGADLITRLDTTFPIQSDGRVASAPSFSLAAEVVAGSGGTPTAISARQALLVREVTPLVAQVQSELPLVRADCCGTDPIELEVLREVISTALSDVALEATRAEPRAGRLDVLRKAVNVRFGALAAAVTPPANSLPTVETDQVAASVAFITNTLASIDAAFARYAAAGATPSFTDKVARASLLQTAIAEGTRRLRSALENGGLSSSELGLVNVAVSRKLNYDPDESMKLGDLVDWLESVGTSDAAYVQNLGEPGLEIIEDQAHTLFMYLTTIVADAQAALPRRDSLAAAADPEVQRELLDLMTALDRLANPAKSA